MFKNGYTRRRVLVSAAVGIFAPSLGRSSRAQGMRKINLTLPWLADGTNAYIFMAKAKGYWAARGLDVTITRGSGSAAAAQAVAAGRFDFGIAVAPSNIALAAKGLPLVHIAVANYDSTMGVCVLETSPIKTAKDLEGKVVAQTPGSGDVPFFPAFAKLAKIDPAKISIVSADANVRPRLLNEGKVDAATGFASTSLPTYAMAKTKARFLLYSEYGLNFYGSSILTRRDVLEKEPDVVRAFVAGLMLSLKASLVDPEEALAVLFKEVPELGMASSGRRQADVAIGNFNLKVASETAKRFGLGASDPAEWERMVDLVMEYAADKGDTRPAATAIYTNDFIGQTMLSPEEWRVAETKATKLAG